MCEQPKTFTLGVSVFCYSTEAIIDARLFSYLLFYKRIEDEGYKESQGNNYISTEHTDYTSGTIIDAASDMDDDSQWGGANVGVVYDINDKHSLGAEVQYNYYGGSSINNTWTEHTLADITTRTDGNYKSRGDNHMTTATLNYIYKLDDKGSVLKFIGDYAYSNSPDRNNYFDREIDPITLLQRDSTYRDNSLSLNQLGTATVALAKVLSPKVTLKAGVKYTYNNNSNTAVYEYFKDEAWMPNLDKSYDIGYTENIGAAYVIASAKLGRVSLVGGLRGEYTNFRDKAGAIAQNYFDLFPNANLSYSLTEDQRNMYRRKSEAIYAKYGEAGDGSGSGVTYGYKGSRL